MKHLLLVFSAALVMGMMVGAMAAPAFAAVKCTGTTSIDCRGGGANSPGSPGSGGFGGKTVLDDASIFTSGGSGLGGMYGAKFQALAKEHERTSSPR
jgi:hypothetical protein